MCQFRQSVKGDVVRIIGVEIFFDPRAFFCHPDRIDRDRLKLTGGAEDAQDQHLQQAPADQFGSVSAGFDFVIDLVKQCSYQCVIVKVTEDLRRGFPSFFLKCDAVDPQHIILQRHFGNRLLRVLKVRGDDDQVPGLDRLDVPVEEKIPFSVQYKENLCKRFANPG